MQLEHSPRWSPEDNDLTDEMNIVVIYDDLAAGQRAMRLLDRMGHGLRDVEFCPKLWRCDFLDDPDWFSVALADGIRADILIIASVRPRVGAAVTKWIEACFQRKQGTTAAVIALLGTSEEPDDRTSSGLQFIQDTAVETGLDFFAPGSPGPQATSTQTEASSSRTSVFSGKIAMPYFHWGLNE